MLALDPPLGEGAPRRSAGCSRAATPGRCAIATGPARDLVVGITMALSDGTVARSGRQGDQERRRLRPREDAQRLVRNPGPDPRARGQAAPARRSSRRPRGRGRRPAASCSAGRPRRSRTPRSRPNAWTPPGRSAEARSWPASRARRPPTRPRPRSRSCPRGPGAGAARGRRGGSGSASAPASARPTGLVAPGRGGADGPAAAGRARRRHRRLARRPRRPRRLLAQARGPLRRGRGGGRRRSCGPACGRAPAWCSTPPPRSARELDVWDESDPGRLALARRLKERFDPTSTLNRGIFVGGI